MKKVLTAVLLVLLALAVLAAAGVLLYRHFVTGQIMDGGNTANPFLPLPELSPLLPESCGFLALSWSQNAMNGDECFQFSLSGGPDAPVLTCSFVGEPGGKRLELGEDETPVSISPARWAQVERMLREMSLPAYQAPAPELSDATVNRLCIDRREANGTARSDAYDGTDAIPLLELLQEIAREAAN